MLEFNVQAMSCSHCVTAVTEAVRAIDPQAGVEVDLSSKTVRVESSASRERVATSLVEAGYSPT